MVILKNENRILQAVDALKALDRDRAVELLNQELHHGPASGNKWQSVSRLAAHIGEINIAIEAARRYSLTEPVSLERQMQYWGDLASFGRTSIALEYVLSRSVSVQSHPVVLHFCGTTAVEVGDFVKADEYFRRALKIAPCQYQTWFALAMIKTFTPSDPDLLAMESLRSSSSKAAPELRARLLYGLAKAWRDCGEFEKAMALYSEGAQIMSGQYVFDVRQTSQFAEQIISNFTAEKMAKLLPCLDISNRTIFVNGLPRSGSTLIEQILTSHSLVADGGEINLLRAALLPTGDYSFDGAIAYQHRTKKADPWSDLANHYHRMITMRFGDHGRIIDKTLSQSQLMGLLLHSLPKAKVIWLRRTPEDAALSCFQTFFSSPIPWSWSLENIGRYFAIEDRLFDHWTSQFPDRILVVPYEELVSDPDIWIKKILSYAELPQEDQVFQFHTTSRSVRTASVQQVRKPISKDRIGAARIYDAYLSGFKKTYYT
jgi:tetratricopeptide (TPR) repeat protein